MDKSSLLKKLFSEKTKDYTYTIAFFIIFSFFIVGIIRPNLISIFEAHDKISQLEKINKQYEDQIDKVIEIQAVMESNRDDLVYLDQAISEKPDVNKVLSDVNVTSEGANLTAQKIDISDINLKDKGDVNKLKSFDIKMNLEGSFDDTLSFVKKIYEQRRLKRVPDLSIDRSAEESSRSSTLNINLNVEGYYL